MSTPLEKVVKLLALATSPNENEARTSAFLAAKLIRENKIVLLAPDDARLFGRGSPPPSYSHARPPPPPPPPKEPPPPPPRRNSTEFPVRINAKFGGFCRVCLLRYEEGDRIYWMRGDGCSHLACGWPE